VVVNLIGREYETRNYSFEEVNHHMAEQLAMVCSVYTSILLPAQLSKHAAYFFVEIFFGGKKNYVGCFLQGMLKTRIWCPAVVKNFSGGPSGSGSHTEIMSQGSQSHYFAYC